MKVGLFDFQEDALGELRAKLMAARLLSSVDDPQVISFSAPTGALGFQHQAALRCASSFPQMNAGDITTRSPSICGPFDPRHGTTVIAACSTW